jgi:hypothetical protein
MDPNQELDDSTAGVQNPLRRPRARLNRLHKKSDALARGGASGADAFCEVERGSKRVVGEAGFEEVAVALGGWALRRVVDDLGVSLDAFHEGVGR